MLNSINRRDFCKSGLAIGGAGFVATDLSGALLNSFTPPSKRFKKAVKIGMVAGTMSLDEKFALLKELGFDGVEMDSPNNLKLNDVKKASENNDLPIHGVVDSVHWRDRLSDKDAAVREKGVEGLKTALRDAKAYGGTSVLLVPGVVNKQVTYEQCWERSIEEIRKVLPLAEELEIDILLENVWNNFLTDPKETAKYIDELDHERVGAYYDVGNSVRYAPAVEWVKILGKRIRKLDIKEYDLAKGKKEGWYKGFAVKLNDGSCEWPKVIAELERIGFSGWGTAEVAGGNRDRLKEIAERMDRIFAHSSQ